METITELKDFPLLPCRVAPGPLGSLGRGGSGSWSPPGQPEDARSIRQGLHATEHILRLSSGMGRRDAPWVSGISSEGHLSLCS